MSGRIMAAAMVATLLLLGGCDLVPPSSRPGWVPRGAELERDFKGGWGWSQCLDARTGSVEFRWSSKSKNPDPFVTVRPVTCVAAREPEAERTFEVTKGSDEVQFWFPGYVEITTGPPGPCPQQISPETRQQFISTLGAVAAISQESVEALVGIRTQMTTLAPERLWHHGGRSGHFMCADISHVIPESGPSFPDHLRTGR